MATLTNMPNGTRFIQFPVAGGRRVTIHLGRMEKKNAANVRSHVENLIRHRIDRQPLPQQTSIWLVEIADSLHAKIAKARLVLPRSSATELELGRYVDAYIARRTDLKERTVKNLKQVRKHLVKHLGEKAWMPSITAGDMADWRRKLKKTLADATVAMHVKKARQIFADAVSRRLMQENPAMAVKVGSMANEDRVKYVPASDVTRCIDKCPDAEWRLIFALARFGGLRVPSEILRLRWEDIRWDEGRFTVHSPKTEHHKGKASREVPIFPELAPYLREALEAGEPARHAIVLHRGDNLRTQAERIIRLAGLVPWEKLFQNLRASCETDLAARFPAHVACAWIGNTEAVARKHYLKVTDADFESAAKSAADNRGQTRTEPENQKQNPRITGGSARNAYPQGGANNPRIDAKRLKVPRPALRKALRRLKKTVPWADRAAIASMARRGGRRC